MDDPQATTIAERLLREVAPALAARIPRATYRLQLHPGFTFDDAAAIVPYLARLGISHLYLSPPFRARPGSTHGYDVVAYDQLNPELGGEAGFDRLAAAARAHDLGIILDFVPNHMGIGQGTNGWWLDVLENGRGSPYATYFDIDWEPVKPELRGKVLVPTLGDHYGVVLERGELQLRFDRTAGTFTLHYYDNPFPIAPPTYVRILRQALTLLQPPAGADTQPEPPATGAPPDDHDLLELQSVITALEHLPADETDPERLTAKTREQIVAKRRIADLVGRSPLVADAIEQAVASFNGTPGDPASFDLLDQLLEQQHFRLAFWRVAAEEINYRRFFAINELAAIRQEEPAVFAATHTLLLDLLASERAVGVRLDHPDGLWDPAGYASRLQRAYLLACLRRRVEAERQPGGEEPGWEQIGPAVEALLADQVTPPALPLYLVVEKILEHGESLPGDWPVHGTTGYEFANAVTALFVDPEGRRAFDELYARVVGEKVRFADLVYACKHLIMRVALASEVAVLSTYLDRITEQTRRFRDFTLNNLRDALREVIACFPVYRTYLVCGPEGDAEITERDRRYIEQAIREAKRRNRNLDPTTLDFLRDVLLQRRWEGASTDLLAAQCYFTMKLQQLSGPVMAKGLEDTAFYRYNRLVALNEVGGDPAQFGLPLAAFHRQNTERGRQRPHSLLASSTHDTKRSEDVRARIAVLSELPREWRAAVNRWSRLNRRHRSKVEGQPAPDRNDEYLLYQTLLGAWPLDAEPGAPATDAFVARIVAYMEKAQREASTHTSWTNPDETYETATAGFVRAVLVARGAGAFLADFAPLQRRVAEAGALNALAAQLLKLTVPGVPDVYQGTELWDLSLVDPDNRRPVDFAHRRQLLDALIQGAERDPGALAREVVASWPDGRVKLLVTLRALACRAAYPDLFAAGDYVPLPADGARAEHVCAYLRRHRTSDGRQQDLLVAVPRLSVALPRESGAFPLGESAWGATQLRLPSDLAGASLTNWLTGEVVDLPAGDEPAVRLADLLVSFPVALVTRMD